MKNGEYSINQVAEDLGITPEQVLDKAQEISDIIESGRYARYVRQSEKQNAEYSTDSFGLPVDIMDVAAWAFNALDIIPAWVSVLGTIGIVVFLVWRLW